MTGKGLNGKKISGNLCVCHSNEDLKSFKDGDIIVAADTTNEMMAQMRQASALIGSRGCKLSCNNRGVKP